MTDRAKLITRAYEALGLMGDEDFDVVKAAFRKRVKTVHPDTSEATPQTLARLQTLLKAYEVLRQYAPRRHALVITPEEARKGGLRTVQIGEDRTTMVRIPTGARTGMILSPVGDAHWRIQLSVRDVMVDPQLDKGRKEREARERKLKQLEEQNARAESGEIGGVLAAFLDRFVKASPAARFAGWARGKKDRAA